MKPYRNVKIYPAILTKKKTFTPEEKKDLTKKGLRWYVYFDYLNPQTGKFERQPPVTEKINRNFPDFDDRLEAIKLLKSDIIAILKEGFNPYEVEEKENYTIGAALDFAVKTKKSEVDVETHVRYKGTVKALNKWLANNGYANYSLEKASKKIISEFLRHISQKNSNRTRNNYRSDLSALFGVLLQEDYINDNPAAKIKNLPTAEKRDPTYSEDQVKEILEYLEQHDKLMHLFILMVSYMFWRPKELTRIQIKDINIKERLISEKTKTKGHKTKLIPEVLLPHLEDYIKGADPEHLLFTPNGPGAWDRKDPRRYFTGRYRAIKKKLGIDPQYSIYSFRHSAVTKAYKKLRETMPKEKALEELALITGHTSKAITAYIHYIDAETIEDYSHLL